MFDNRLPWRQHRRARGASGSAGEDQHRQMRRRPRRCDRPVRSTGAGRTRRSRRPTTVFAPAGCAAAGSVVTTCSTVGTADRSTLAHVAALDRSTTTTFAPTTAISALQLRSRTGRIQRHRHRAEPECGEIHDDEVHAVAAHERDTVARLDPERPQPATAVIDLLAKFAVRGGAVVEDQRGRVRRVFVDDAGEIHWTPSRNARPRIPDRTLAQR